MYLLGSTHTHTHPLARRSNCTKLQALAFAFACFVAGEQRALWGIFEEENGWMDPCTMHASARAATVAATGMQAGRAEGEMHCVQKGVNRADCKMMVHQSMCVCLM